MISSLFQDKGKLFDIYTMENQLDSLKLTNVNLKTRTAASIKNSSITLNAATVTDIIFSCVGDSISLRSESGMQVIKVDEISPKTC